jgi:ADP-ribose pyrophosphatase YjhB (NUDIX family)
MTSKPPSSSSSSSSKNNNKPSLTTTNSTANKNTLAYTIDMYKSAIIKDTCLSQTAPLMDLTEFESKLFASLTEFKSKGARGVWLRIPHELAEYIPIAIRCGFTFHSARPEYVTLTAWLPLNEPSKLPPTASHFIGVGAFVLNSKDELLVVREKTGPSARLQDFWKLPGGLCDRQEDFHKAAVRELKEETGIDAEFVSVATIQEVHHSEERAGPARSGTTDLYIICILKAKDENQKIVPCATEIAEAKWLPAKQVLSLPFYAAEGSIFSHMFKHAYEVASGRASGIDVSRLRMGFLPAENNMYFVKTRQDQQQQQQKL